MARSRPLLRILVSAGRTVAMMLFLSIGILVVRLAFGPISISDVSVLIDAALARNLGPSNRVTSGAAELAWTERGLVLAVKDVAIGNAANFHFLAAQKAEVTLDPVALFFAKMTITGVAFVGPIVALNIAKEGRVRLGTAEFQSSMETPDRGIAGEHGLLAIVKELFEDNGPFAAMKNVEVREGRLTVRDERSGEDLQFDDLKFSFRDHADGDYLFSLGLNGPLGTSVLLGTISRRTDRGRQIHLEPSGIPLGYFLLPFVPKQETIGANSPVQGTVDATFDLSDHLQSVTGDLTLGSLAFAASDETAPVILAEKLSVQFFFDPDKRILALREGSISFARTQLLIAGAATATGAGWKVDLVGNARLNGDMADAAIETDSLALHAHLPENLSDLAIDDLEILGEGAKLTLTGHLGADVDGRRGAHIAASAGPMNARNLIALWPQNVSPRLRAAIRDHVVRAKVKRMDLTLNLSGQDVSDLAEGNGIPRDAASVDMDLTDVALIVDLRLPTIVTESLSFHGTGEEANLSVASAGLGEGAGQSGATISDWQMTFSALASLAPIFQTSLRLQGPAASFSGLFKESASPLSKATGSIDANVQARLPLADVTTNLVENLSATGTLADFTVSDIGATRIGIDRAQLQFSLGQDKLTIAGDGQLLGSAAKVLFASNLATGATDAQASLVLDEAACARLGWAPANIGGSISVDLHARLAKFDLDSATVKIDLSKASIKAPVAGFSKSIGKPGRASFEIKSTSKGLSLDNISYSAPPARFAGRAQLSGGGTVSSASLQKVSLSPGDDFDATLERRGRVWKIVTNGKVLDARPFLAALRDRSGHDLLFSDVQIEAKIARLTGYSGERIDDANISLQLNTRGLQQFSLVGGMGSGRITATLDNNRGGELTLETSDVAALLRYLDVYHSMVGGRGSLRASFERDQLRGKASVEEFILSSDVLLNKSAEVIRQTDGKVKQERRVDERFQKLILDFAGGDSKIDIGNAILTGSNVGITFDGWIDLAAQSMSIAGTYVPAYGLNSFLTSIPMVGTILGGGEDGLLGITFRLDGSLQAPQVRVNPLSAIAPGIFRRIFGYEPRRK